MRDLIALFATTNRAGKGIRKTGLIIRNRAILVSIHSIHSQFHLYTSFVLAQADGVVDIYAYTATRRHALYGERSVCLSRVIGGDSRAQKGEEQVEVEISGGVGV
jgi:hypothetical protein